MGETPCTGGGRFIFYPGGSAVWPQCWLCAVCAVGRVGCCVGGGGPVGVSISSKSESPCTGGGGEEKS